MLAGITERILALDGWVALAIVFLIPALEASAFLGFVFPGEIAVLLGGVLAFNGRVPLPAVIVAAVAGAIVGDTIGYFVGRRWGRRILRGVGARVPFLRHRIDEHLQTAQAYVRRRGGAAVFFGRFTAALRVMVPGLAGMAEIPYGQFAFYNAAGGLIWGTGFVLLGYFAGAAWHRVAADASRAGLALLVAVLVGLVVGRVLRNVREHGERLPDRFARIAPVAWARGRFPRGSAWLARRIDTTAPSGFLLSVVVVAGAACAWIFIGLTQDVIAHEEAALSDPGVTRFVVDHRVGWVTSLMKDVTWLGSNAVLIPLVVVLGGYLLMRKTDWRAPVLLAAALAGANAWYHIAKPLVARERPPESLHLITVSGYAFPSGHATAAIAVWGAAAIVLSSGRPVRWKAAFWLGAGLIAALVSFSRVYLGVHWWTDVVSGMALGGAWLCLLGAGLLLGVGRSWVAIGPRHEIEPTEPDPTSSETQPA
jgi:membrane protein DedA with SNARE-associated domain/membrane-associated phospholipid phosphatase